MSSHANKNIGRIARLLAIAAVLLFPLAASAAQDKTLRAPARPPAPAAAPAKPHLNVLREAEAWGVWGENRIKDFSGEVSGIRLDRFLIKPEPHQASGLPGDESAVASAEYYFGDALQSVHQVTDATGFEIRRQFTDAWGNEIAGVGFGTTGPGDRYGFQGRESDSESGLQHFRARSYDPMTGRFTSRDPVPHSNLYHFVENNPVNATDPSGLDSIIEEGTKVSWQFVKDGITVSIPLGSKQNNGNVKMFGGFARTNIDISELTGRARDTDAGKYADSYAAINIALGGHVEKAESADLAGWDKGVAVAGRAGARLEQAATGAVLSVGTGGVGGAAGGGYMFMRGVSGYLGEWDPSWDFVRLAYEKDLGEAAPYVDFTADVVSGAMAGGGLADEPPLNVLTPRPRSLKVTLPEAYGPPKPGQYSTAFEVQLKATDLGRSRSVHFGRSNEALEAAMDADPALARTMEDMIPGVRAAIGSVGGRATPSGWIWHHATRAEAQGRAGVMRLVPEAQHEPQSVFWRILHPDKGARGGYSEWAIPAGAPKN